MPPLAIAGVGLAVGAVGAISSAKSNKKAAQYAADTSYRTAQSNNALAANIYGQNKATLTPFINTGLNAGRNLNAMLGLGTAEEMQGAQTAFGDYIKASDYGFQFGQGSNALNSGYAGAGTLQSGAAMKELEKFRQGLQSGYRGEYMNALGNQQGVGLGAASALAGVNQNYVNTISANNNNASSAAANAALIKAQNNPFAQVAGLIGGGLFSYGAGRM